MRFVFSILILLLGILDAQAWSPTIGVSSPQQGGGGFTPTAQEAKVGAGGYVTDITIYPTAPLTEFTRNDTGQYYTWGAAHCTGGLTLCWFPSLSAFNLPAVDLSGPPATQPSVMGAAKGGYAIAACAYTTESSPTLIGDVQHQFAVYNGYMYRTTDGEATWTRLSQAIAGVNANDATQKSIAPYNWCDPQSSDLIDYESVPSAPPVVTCDGGTTWNTVSGLPSPSNAGEVIVGDPTSAVVAGVTQHFFIAVNGTGVYETTNGGTCGGGSFTLANSGTMPTTVYNMWVDKYGYLYAITGTSTGLRIYYGGTWTTTASETCGNCNLKSIAIDPTATSHATETVLVFSPSGWPEVSRNGGASFISGYGGCTSTLSTATGGDIPWIGGFSNDLNLGQAEFDLSHNTLESGGSALWYIATASMPIANCVYSSQSAGLETLTSLVQWSSPGLDRFSSSWDFGVQQQANPDTFPNHNFPTFSDCSAHCAGWDVTNAASDPSYVFFLIDDEGAGGSDHSGYTKDGGNTYVKFASLPASEGGMIACDTITDCIEIQNQGGGIYCTTNGGGSWGAIAGLPTSGWLNTYYIRRHVLAADWTTPNTLYAYSAGNGVYSTTTGCGGSWSHVFTGYIGGSGTPDGYNAILQNAPWSPGELYFTFGPEGSGAGNVPSNPLYRSLNGGTTWNSITNVGSANQIGFGAPKPGGVGKATLCMNGWITVSGTATWGFWRSVDDGATAGGWSSAGNLLGSVEQPVWTTCDVNVYGRIYMMGAQGDTNYYDFLDACPAVSWKNVNPNSTISGSMTLQAWHSGLVPVSQVNFFVDGTLIGSQTSSSGTPPVYSQSFDTSAVASGAHMLSVATSGNLTNNPNCTVNQFSGHVSAGSLSTLVVDSGTAPLIGQLLAGPGFTKYPPIVTASLGGGSYMISPPAPAAISSHAMAGSSAMFTIPVTK